MSEFAFYIIIHAKTKAQISCAMRFTMQLIRAFGFAIRVTGIV